jgi:hypothetical protein
MKLTSEGIYHAGEQDSWKPWWKKDHGGYNSEEPSTTIGRELQQLVDDGKIKKFEDINIKITIEISKITDGDKK